MKKKLKAKRIPNSGQLKLITLKSKQRKIQKPQQMVVNIQLKRNVKSLMQSMMIFMKLYYRTHYGVNIDPLHI